MELNVVNINIKHSNTYWDGSEVEPPESVSYLLENICVGGVAGEPEAFTPVIYDGPASPQDLVAVEEATARPVVGRRECYLFG